MKLRHFALLAALMIFTGSILIAAEDQPKPDAPKQDQPKKDEPKKDQPKPDPVGGGKVIRLDPKNIKNIKIDPNDPDQKIKIVQPTKKKVEPKVSATAKAELDKITAAYKKLNSIELAGKLSADIDLGGEKQARGATFTALFQAPNKFRHEMKEQKVEGDAKPSTMVVGSTGQSLFIFNPDLNEYLSVDAPKDRVACSKIPQPMRQVLEMQDPGLMCAVVDDAGKYLAEDTLEVSGPVDTKVDGKACLALDFRGEKMDYRVLVSPDSHLVRQVVLDMKRSIESAGRADVKKFVLTFDYSKVAPETAVKAEAFAWAAPEGAKEAAATPQNDPHEMMAQAAQAVGTEAPDFTLKGLDGKDVTLSKHKGSVVVLDFWATWCGPCKVSLPGLNKIYNDLKGKGLVVYAIDQHEDKGKVQAVATELKLDIPVLLDENSEVGGKYGANAIPHTVVIGKDQKIAAVLTGSGNEEKIRAAVEKAMEK